MDPSADFIATTAIEIEKLRKTAERALAQVDDDAFFHALDAESNSLAVLVKHLGGNLRSRWTDFLKSDGEKPGRDRDGEFEIREGDTRASLMASWEDGWDTFGGAVRGLRAAELGATVRIRGEALTALAAVQRALAHAATHVGQIVYLAKHLVGGGWTNLSVPKGKSAEYNRAVRQQAEGPAARP